MLIKTKYDIGDVVFLITDPDQHPRIITSISVRPQNNIVYEMACGGNSTDHYDLEFTYDRDIVKATTGER